MVQRELPSTLPYPSCLERFRYSTPTECQHTPADDYILLGQEGSYVCDCGISETSRPDNETIVLSSLCVVI